MAVKWLSMHLSINMRNKASANFGGGDDCGGYVASEIHLAAVARIHSAQNVAMPQGKAVI